MSVSFPALCRSSSVPDIHQHTASSSTVAISPSLTTTAPSTPIDIPSVKETTTKMTLNNSFTNHSSNTLMNSFSNSRECISNDDEDSDNDDGDDGDNNHSTSELKTYMHNSKSRFRRHSSHNHNLMNTALSGSNERICSSPINTLKMSSRVCQIKIDEGIELHLSREIKSERDIQNTLKLKSSYDELNIDKMYNEEQQQQNSSQSSKFRRYRTCSDSINNNNNGLTPQARNSPLSPMWTNPLSPSVDISLLRCYSPAAASSTTTTATSVNMFNSPNPSPTSKLFITRRSMSPINLKQAQQVLPQLHTSTKRKLSDIDNDSMLNTSAKKAALCSYDSNENSNSSTSSNQSKTNNSSDIQFAQPLVVNTNFSSTVNTSNEQNTCTTTSATSIFQSPSSLTFPNNNIKPSSVNSSNSQYTFIPIQPPSQQQQHQHRLLVRPNNINLITTNCLMNSPINSPSARYCDSPSSYSSLSIMSTSEKPDSGYQSSVQNNSDSESCT